MNKKTCFRLTIVTLALIFSLSLLVQPQAIAGNELGNAINSAIDNSGMSTAQKTELRDSAQRKLDRGVPASDVRSFVNGMIGAHALFGGTSIPTTQVSLGNPGSFANALGANIHPPPGPPSNVAGSRDNFDSDLTVANTGAQGQGRSFWHSGGAWTGDGRNTRSLSGGSGDPSSLNTGRTHVVNTVVDHPNSDLTANQPHPLPNTLTGLGIWNRGYWDSNLIWDMWRRANRHPGEDGLAHTTGRDVSTDAN